MGWDILRSVLDEAMICPHAKCQICFDFIKDPVQCKGCQNHFCRACIDQWKKKGNHCPNQCPAALYKEGHRLMKQIISEIMLHCKNKKHGCDQACKIKDLLIHQASCPYYLIKCPHQGCEQEVPALYLKDHKMKCPFWKWACPRKCGFKTQDIALPEKHDCDLFTIQKMKEFEQQEKKLKEDKMAGTDAYFNHMKDFGQFKLRMKLLEIRNAHFPEEKKDDFKLQF